MSGVAARTPFRLGDDPLTYALEPPPDETEEEKTSREAKEAEAKRVSDQIDESLRNDRAAMKKEKEVVKVLLLGQSESGEYDAFLLIDANSYSFDCRQKYDIKK